MVTSPNKRRLYLAQEGLIDASTTGIENIIPDHRRITISLGTSQTTLRRRDRREPI